MQPLAHVLTVLEGEISCYFGYLLPSILSLKSKLQAMQSQVYVGPLVDAVLAGLEKRYGGVLAFDNSSEANDMILSSVTHPFFKLRWVPGDKIDNIRQRFLQAVSIASISLELQQLDKSDEPVDALACDDFFVFNNSSKNSAQ